MAIFLFKLFFNLLGRNKEFLFMEKKRIRKKILENIVKLENNLKAVKPYFSKVPRG
ncbi:MAG: hypothetical protein MZV64_64775 [Ignavibacteriales bacterium]|nr:hypothetical protein [Ignavibacteriales bacterium]